jgi:hypothetical protein
VTEADPLLDRAAIQDAFRRLGERLARRGGASAAAFPASPGGSSGQARGAAAPGRRISPGQPSSASAWDAGAAASVWPQARDTAIDATNAAAKPAGQPLMRHFGNPQGTSNS